MYHHQVITFPVFEKNKNYYSAKVDLLELIKYEIVQPKSTWDVYIKIWNEKENLMNEYPFNINLSSGIVGIRHYILNTVEMKFYKNYMNALSLTISINKSLFKLNHIEIEESIKLKGIVKGLTIDKFILKKEATFDNGELINTVRELTCHQFNNNFSADIPIMKILNEIRLEDDAVYTFFWRIKRSKNGYNISCTYLYK
ncbi:hypothetical protein RWE15_06185 [Virgibacillus halophilus]|uniref:Uncharacterized protein n=1 Tax=Tigheibacillus halophilus TaxID=361280 RepID=A0ABU5C4I6_9BACI|nr:hypothetical protein [Virgibacillus halophilus]